MGGLWHCYTHINAIPVRKKSTVLDGGEGQLLIKRDCNNYDLSAPPLRMPRRQLKEILGRIDIWSPWVGEDGMGMILKF